MCSIKFNLLMGYFKKVLAVGLVLCAVGAIINIALLPKGIRITRVEFFNSKGGRLVGDLYLPEGVKGPLPEMLLCHGVELSKEAMAQLGVEFAKRGFAALSFDYGGYGESDKHGGDLKLMLDDTRAALKFLDGIPETKGNESVGMIGHSMGVTYSIATAGDLDRVDGVVGLGNDAVIPSVPPRNVALAMGLYEELHTVPDMLQSVRESANNKSLMPDEVGGDFKDGTARALLISAVTEHGAEPFEPVMMRKTISWFRGAMPNIVIPEMKLTEPYRTQGYVIFYFGGLFAIIALTVIVAAPRMASHKSGQHMLALRAYFLPVAALGLVANFVGPQTAILMTDLSMMLLVGGSIGSAVARKGANSPDTEKAFAEAGAAFRTGGGYWILVLAIFFVCLIVGGLSPAIKLGALKHIAAFLYYSITLLPYIIVNMFRTDFFYRYSEAWIPSIYLALAIVAELARPGVITELLSRGIMVTIEAFKFKGPFKIFSSKKEIAAAVVIFGLMATVFATRYKEGWLTMDALGPMIAISLKYMILPVVLFILAVNVRYRREAASDRKNSEQKRIS